LERLTEMPLACRCFHWQCVEALRACSGYHAFVEGRALLLTVLVPFGWRGGRG